MRRLHVFVQDEYHYVYKVINEHVNRIENSTDRCTQISSPCSAPCRPAPTAPTTPYWHKWVSPDELPCRDVKTARSLPPRRTRDRAPRICRPCDKRKSSAGETAEPKRPRRDARKREKREESPSPRRARIELEATKPQTDSRGREKCRSTSPCYNLPQTERGRSPCRPMCRPVCPHDELPASGGEAETSASKLVRELVQKTQELKETVHGSREDGRTKPSDKKVLCGQRDADGCENVSPANCADSQLDPCRNRVAPSDLIANCVPCSQQTDSQRVTEESPRERATADLARDKIIISDTAKPCGPYLRLYCLQETRIHNVPVCEPKESPKTQTEMFDLPEEAPSRQKAGTVRARRTSNKTREPQSDSAEIRQTHTRPERQAVRKTYRNKGREEDPETLTREQTMPNKQQDYKPKSSTKPSREKVPYGKRDADSSENVPQASPDSRLDPSRNKVSLSAPYDLTAKCMQPDLQPVTEERTIPEIWQTDTKPCKPDTKGTESRAASAERKHKDKAKTDDQTNAQRDASKDEKAHRRSAVRCKKISKPAVPDTQQLPRSNTDPTHPPVKTSTDNSCDCDKPKTSEIMDADTEPVTESTISRDPKPDRHAVRKSYKKKRCKEDPATLTRVKQTMPSKQDYKQTSASQTHEQKQQLPRSNTVPTHPPVKTSTDNSCECDKPKNSETVEADTEPVMEPAISRDPKPDRVRKSYKNKRWEEDPATLTRVKQTMPSKQDYKQTSASETHEQKPLISGETPCKQKTQLSENQNISETTSAENPCKSSKDPEPHAETAQESAKTKTEMFDLPEEVPYKQNASARTARRRCYKARKPKTDSSEIRQTQLHTGTESRAASAERKYKDNATTDDHTNVQMEASEDEKAHEHTAEKYKEIPKPAVPDTQQLPRSNIVPTHPPVKTLTDSSERDQLKISETMEADTEPVVEPVVLPEQKPDSQREQLPSSDIVSTHPPVTTSLYKPCHKLLTAGEIPCKQNMPLSESLNISETRNAERPCKSCKDPEPCATTQEETVATSVMTEDAVGLSKEKPCKKKPKAVTETDEIPKHEEVQSEKRFSDTEPKKPCKKKAVVEKQPVCNDRIPCRENRIQQESLQMNDFAGIMAAVTQIPVLAGMYKQNPCQPKTQTKVLFPFYQTLASDTESCKDKTLADTSTDSQVTKTSQLARFVYGRDNENQWNGGQQYSKEQEPGVCTAEGNIDRIVPETFRTPLSPPGQSETSAGKQMFFAATATSVPEYDDESSISEEICEELEEELTASSYSPRTDADGFGCPDIDKSLTQQLQTFTDSQKEEKDSCGCPDMEMSLTLQENVRSSRQEEDADAATIPELSMLSNNAKQKCRQILPCQRELDDTKSQKDISVDDGGPCHAKSGTSNQSVESTSRLLSRCRETRILKLFKYNKRSSCKPTLLPDSSASLLSGSSGLSHCRDTDDTESDLSSLYQSTSTLTKNQTLRRDVLSDADAREKLTERSECSEKTTTTESVQRFTTDLDIIGTRKAQSDDHDIMTRRQNLSSETATRTSEPSIDVSDTWAVTTESSSARTARKDFGISKANSKRRDSGPNLTHHSKETRVPDKIEEDEHLSESWDSPVSDPKQQFDAVRDGHSRSGAKSADKRKDLGPVPTHRSKERILDKVEEGEDWDSTECSSSETSSQVHDTS